MFPHDTDNDSKKTRVLLTSAGYVHLKQQHFPKHMRNLSLVSRAILLSGPAGILCSSSILSCRDYFGF